MAAGDRSTAPWCPDDDAVVAEPARAYECSRCGERTNSAALAGERARCEGCNIFMARAEEDACPDCSAPLEDMEVIEDHDGALVKADQFDPVGPSFHEREAAERAELEALRQAQQAAQEARVAEESAITTWSELEPGDDLPQVYLGEVEHHTVERVMIGHAGQDRKSVVEGKRVKSRKRR